MDASFHLLMDVRKMTLLLSVNTAKNLKILKRRVKMKIFDSNEEREEFRRLIQAETQRMKDDRKRMMKEGRKHLMWIAALLSILAIYEIWIIPWLEVYLGIKK